jgi:hypothetical protein
MIMASQWSLNVSEKLKGELQAISICKILSLSLSLFLIGKKAQYGPVGSIFFSFFFLQLEPVAQLVGQLYLNKASY